jgi:glycosyltransferase involved in cell wall biosynthesis
MMHLAINATDIGRQRGGNEAYLSGLLDGFTSLVDSQERFTLITCRSGAQILSARAWPDRFQVVDAGPWRRWPSYLWQQTRAIRRAKADCYLSTFLLPLVVPCRAAVLIHDLSFRAHPDYFPLSIATYMRVLVNLAVRRADRVIALSEFTRAEPRRFYPAALDKTIVVYPGIDASFTVKCNLSADQAILREYGLESPYILAVGNIHPRKNLGRLLEAYERLRNRRTDTPPMVWAGVERWGSDQLLQRARALGVKMTGRVAAQHLPAVYRQATIMVYPSLYEGFGLPPLEAMACGTPVIASNTTSLPEAVGDAAVQVDPLSVKGLSDAMEQLLFDSRLRAQLRARGLMRAKRFSWDKAARSVVESLSL